MAEFRKACSVPKQKRKESSEQENAQSKAPSARQHHIVFILFYTQNQIWDHTERIKYYQGLLLLSQSHI